jgi:LEA14-like dessication related protein
LRLLVAFVLLGLASCASLNGIVSPPKISISGIELLPTNNLQPKFAVHLNILNQNAVAIPVTGLSYNISLNGSEVFSGATSNVPVLPAYEEVPVRLEVSANLLQSISFINGLMKGSFSALDYSIDAKVKVSGVITPFHIVEAGRVDFIQ